MTLPEYIEALNAPSGNNTPYGIIERIRGNVGSSNILSYVYPTNYGDQVSSGNTNNPILQSGYWQGSGTNNYWQVEFKNRFVLPTHYSLRGAPGRTTSKDWLLYGFSSEGIDYTLLSNDTYIGTTFGAYSTSDWATWSIKYPPNRVFRYFRFTHPGYKYFAFSGIEFFGIFSTNGSTQSVNMMKLQCYTYIPLFFRFQTSLFLIFITLMS
jgi:hypothetical protein